MPKKLTFTGRAAAIANGLLSPSTSTSQGAENPRGSPKFLCSQISAFAQSLEQQCDAVETENDGLKTQVAAAQQQLSAERHKHSGERKAKEIIIAVLKKDIQKLQAVNNSLQREVASAQQKYQQELEIKDAALQDLEDANRLSVQVSQDLSVSKEVSEDLKTALEQAEASARDKALEVEASTQIAMEAQNQRITDLEAQLKECERLLEDNAVFYDSCKASIRNANFYVSVYETAMRAAFHSFDPVDGQPYFRTILQKVYERKFWRYYTPVKPDVDSVGSEDDVDAEQAMPLPQAECDGESSDDDEPILKKLRRKRIAEENDDNLEKKRICLGEDGNDGGKEDGDEGGDAAADEYSTIFAEQDDEEFDDARSDDGEDDEWLPDDQ